MNLNLRLAAGSVTVVTITGSTSYLIKNFTRPADMGTFNLWYCDASPPEKPLRRTSQAGSVLDQGHYLSQLSFETFTFGMRDYFKDTFYAGSETAASANVTVGLFTPSNEAFYMQCVMVMPNWGELARNGQQIHRGYRNVIWSLIQGTQIT